jgi:tRNA A-37 threonylcarbamoyl transferase component Bud32
MIDKLHNKSISHNDLHMDNILVIDRGKQNLSFRIIDFEQSTILFNPKDTQQDFYSLYLNSILCEHKNQKKFSKVLKNVFEIDEESDQESDQDFYYIKSNIS